MPLIGPVRAWMSTDVDAVPWDAPVSSVRRLLREHPYHHVPVVDGDRVVGILSAVDVARISLEAWGTDIATVDAHLDAHFQLAELMTPEPETIEAGADVYRAAERLAEGRFHALPVTEDGRLVGMITSTDILRAVVA